MNAVAAIGGADRRLVVAPCRGEIIERMQAAKCAQPADNVFRHRPFIETGAAALGDDAQSFGQFRLAVNVAGFGRLAAGQEDARRRLVGRQISVSG